MRIAIFSDIHANRESFDACLAHASRQGFERLAFLGDMVGYGADPQYVIDRVAAFIDDNAIVLRGNHDEAAASANCEGMNQYARDAIEWTHRKLDSASRKLLHDLPLTTLNDDILFVHSEASDPAEWHYVRDCESAERSLAGCDERITFCGHVHVPQLYNMGNRGQARFFKPPAGVSIPLIGHRKWLAVMGSVGQPRDRKPAASYAIFETTTRELTYVRVPYDIETAAAKIHAAGLPAMLAARLFVGR